MSELRQYALTGQPLRLFPVIDMHGHVGAWPQFDLSPLADRVAVMDRTGVAVSVVSSLRAIAGDIVAGNDEVLEAICGFPGRYLGYVHVSANYPGNMQSELDRCFAEPGVCGIKVYQNGIPFTDPRFTPVWEEAVLRGVPVLAHTWAGDLTGFDTVAAAYPTVAFLAAHAGSDFRYAPYLDAARRVPNLYLDLTLSREYTGMIELFVREIGAERIIWGSDEPLFSMAHQLAKILLAGITDEEKKTILYRNGARLFKHALPEEIRGMETQASARS